MGERVRQDRTPASTVDLVVNRLRHTVLPALDTVYTGASKIRSDLVICNGALLEIAKGCKESDRELHDAIKSIAESVSDSAYLSRKLKDDLEQFVGNQVRGQATALSRLNLK